MITEEVLEKARQAFAAKAAEFAEKVQPYYQVMNWKWAPCGPDGDEYIPSVDDIIVTVGQLSARLKPSEDTTMVDVSSGGIQLSVTVYPKLGDHCKVQIDFLSISVRASI